LLEPVREFCRGVQKDAWNDGSLTEAQIEAQCYRLGKLSTFRALHSLISGFGKPNTTEFNEVSLECMRIDAMGWLGLGTTPTKEDFETADSSYWSKGYEVRFKGKETGFNFQHLSSEFGQSNKSPLIRKYKYFCSWKHEYSTVDAALADTVEYIMENLVGDKPPFAGLRVISGGKERKA
jgi:hypothetical protein